MAQLSEIDQAALDSLNGVTNDSTNNNTGLSQNDQKALALLNQGQSIDTPQEKIGFSGGVKETLKSKLVSSIRGLTPNFIEDAVTGSDVSEEEELLQAKIAETPFQWTTNLSNNDLSSLFELREERRQRAAEEFLGLEPSNAEYSKGGRIGSGVTDVLLDPETWATGPAGVTTKVAMSQAGRSTVQNIIRKGTQVAPTNRLAPNAQLPPMQAFNRKANAALLGVEGTLGGAGGVIGAEVGGDVAASYQMGPEATTATVLGSSLLGGGLSSSGTGTVLRAGRAGTKTLGTAYRKDPKAGETYIATAQVKNLLDTALVNDPNMLGKVTEFMESVKGIPELEEFVDPWVAMVDNPIMKSEFVNVLRIPEFRAVFEPRLKEAKEVLKQHKIKTYGDPSITKQGVYKFAEKRAEAGKKELQKIEDKIEKMSGFLRQGDQVSDFKLGEIILSQVKQKKASIKAILAPRYTQLSADAAAENIVFDASNTSALFDFAKNQINEDVFRRFPKVFNDIIGKWKAVPVKGPDGKPVLDANGNVVKEFPEADYKQIDSLKRAINKSIGNTSDQKDLMELFNLKEAFGQQLDTLDPKFVDDYRSVDYDYYTMLGHPLNQASIKKISASRFARDSVPTLTTEQGAKEYLTVLGADGVPVIRQAVLAKLADKAVNKDGSFDMNSLNKALLDRNMAPVIEMAGMTNVLKDKNALFDLMNASLVNHQRNYSNTSVEYAESFFGAAYEKSLDTVVNDVLEGNRVGAKILNEIDGFGAEAKEMATTALQSNLVDRVLESNLPVGEFMQNNKHAFERIFGKDYAEGIDSMTRIMNQLGEVNIHDLMIGNKSAAKGPVEKVINVPVSGLVSVARDRISSTYHKVIIIGSKLNQGRVDKQSRQTMADFMRNKEVIESFKKMEKLTKNGVPWRKAMEQTSGVFFRSIVMGSNVGGRAGLETQKEQQ